MTDLLPGAPAGVSRRRFLTGLLAGAATLAAPACATGAEGEQGAASPSVGATTSPTAGSTASASAAATTAATTAAGTGTIRVATFTNNHAAAPLYWSQFAPQGVTVQATTLTSGTDMNRALEADELDFALFGLVNGFTESTEGLGSRIVAAGARRGAGLVVRADSDIADVAALAGRRIGFKGPAFQSLVLFSLLEAAGLDPEGDVELVPVEWNDMPTALEAGSVNAFMGTEPNPSRAVATGVGRRLVDPYTTPVGDLNSCIWASRRMVDEQPELCRVAVDLQRQAAEFLSPGGENDPAVWEELIVGQYGLEEPVYRELLTNVGAIWRLDEERVAQARATGAKMAELGLLPAEPAYDDLIRTEFQPA